VSFLIFITDYEEVSLITSIGIGDGTKH
jgi:hypothetical protein